MALWTNPLAMFESMLNYVTWTGRHIGLVGSLEGDPLRFASVEAPGEATWEVSRERLSDFASYQAVTEGSVIGSGIQAEILHRHANEVGGLASILRATHASGQLGFELSHAEAGHASRDTPEINQPTLFERLLDDAS